MIRRTFRVFCLAIWIGIVAPAPLLAEGGSAKEVAASLSISPRTVEFHKYQMMETLDLHTSADLVRFAIKNGLVGP